MATITKATLRNDVLVHIGAYASGETPSAEDAADVDAVIDYVHEVLIGKGLAHWETSAIPDYAVLPMMAMVSFWTRPKFERPLLQGGQSEWTIGEQGLRRQVGRSLNGEPVEALYY